MFSFYLTTSTEIMLFDFIFKKKHKYLRHTDIRGNHIIHTGFINLRFIFHFQIIKKDGNVNYKEY